MLRPYRKEEKSSRKKVEMKKMIKKESHNKSEEKNCKRKKRKGEGRVPSHLLCDGLRVCTI